MWKWYINKNYLNKKGIKKRKQRKKMVSTRILWGERLFKFVFVQEEIEIEGFLIKVNEWCVGLCEIIENFDDLIEEGQKFSH